MKLLTAFVMIAALAAPALADKKVEREEVSQADAEKFFAFFNKFVDAVVGNKDNCPKMAGAVNGVIDAHLDVVKQANAAKAANKKLPKAYEEKMMARVKEMMPAMQKCGGDADVKKAVARLDAKASEAAKK